MHSMAAPTGKVHNNYKQVHACIYVFEAALIMYRFCSGIASTLHGLTVQHCGR